MTPRSFLAGVARRLRRLLGTAKPLAPSAGQQAPRKSPRTSAAPRTPRSRAPRPEPVKIAVIGNCQRVQLASCLSQLTPDAIARPAPRDLPDIGSTIEGNDFVLVQPSVFAQLEALTPAQRAKIIVYPRFYFPAFHPDLIQPPQTPSPIGRRGMNSGLALYGWLQGLSVEDTAHLYRAEVFEQLGFFNEWERSKRLLLKEAADCGMPFDTMFESWRQTGCFAYHPAHPKVIVVADMARGIIGRLGLRLRDRPANDLRDLLARGAQWPVYPGIAAQLGFEGSFDFVSPSSAELVRETLSLPEFIEASFAIFDEHKPDKNSFSPLQWESYQRILSLPSVKTDAAKPCAPKNPYTDLPDRQFWRRAVEQSPPADVDPVQSAPFAFNNQTRIATAGSCFAQNISRALLQRGFNYFVAEQAPPEMAPDEAATRNFGVFSARYGNIYTARQLLQLFDRAFNRFEPHIEPWKRPDGRYADPFRPRIEPHGFETVTEMLADRERHLAAVKRMFETLDIFVFTLGLTEAWTAKRDGAVLPLAPGVVASGMNSSRYEFVNFHAKDVTLDLLTFAKRLGDVNASAKMILTVSPVPLVATYENRHVLVSTTYSKSALRVAAEDVAAKLENVWYFPSYEIVTGNFNRGAYFEKDLRSVTPEGVDHVMRLFFQHGARKEELPEMSHGEDENVERVADEPEAPAGNLLAGDAGLEDAARDAEALRGFEIVCDEEELEKSAA